MFLSSFTDEFHLIVPNESQNAEVKLGSDVTIPCHLSPEISAADMEIRWFKETNCACLYKNKEVIEGRSYEGRTGLSTEELNKGNVSLNFREFKESDMGVYLCQVISEERTEEITIEVEGEYNFYSSTMSSTVSYQKEMNLEVISQLLHQTQSNTCSCIKLCLVPSERKDSDGQPVNQSSKIQGRQVHLILHEVRHTLLDIVDI